MPDRGTRHTFHPFSIEIATIHIGTTILYLNKVKRLYMKLNIELI